MPGFTLQVHGLDPSEARDAAYLHITLTLEGFKDGNPQPDNLEVTKQRFSIRSVDRAPMSGTYHVRFYGAFEDVARFLREEIKVGVKRTI